jgi:pimeloyl-ACP methyl ester carboxylesterase
VRDALYVAASHACFGQANGVTGVSVTDYVLVHGGWRGGWIWKRVRDRLAAAGHRVFTPTFTGLGERAHLLDRDVGLETHIDDVANLLVWEELQDVALVVHSYGGFVGRHVADRMPERLRSLVYLDAFVPDNGKRIQDYVPDIKFDEVAAAHGDGWKVPPIPAAVFCDNAADIAWVDRQTTRHPLSTLETPARLTGACDEVGNIGYILARKYRESPFPQFYPRAAERGWWQTELPCGHDVMLDMPDELTALLLARM